VALSLPLGLASAQGVAPREVHCVATATVGCSEEGICISDLLVRRKPVVFNLARKKFSSEMGRGRITQVYDDPRSGRHVLVLSAAPASADYAIDNDWQSANFNGVIYDCRIVRK
jgi:hypothetical protein